MPFVDFARSSRPGGEEYSGQRLLNYYTRRNGDRSILVLGSGLQRVPGTVAGDPIVAMAKIGPSDQVDETIIYIRGTSVYRWRTTNNSQILIGTISRDGAVPQIATSERDAAIVSAGRYYVVDGVASTISEISPGQVTSAKDVEYMDGYFVVVGADANRSDVISVSALDDPTTFPALSFAYAEESPDGLIAVKRLGRSLVLFGTQTMQVYYNAGAGEFPFAPSLGSTSNNGCLRAATVCEIDGALYWVRDDYAVVRSFGAGAEIISTPEVWQELVKGDADNSLKPLSAFGFTDRGSEFYALHRTGGTTFCFDIPNGQWLERSSGTDGGFPSYGPWDAVAGVTFKGRQLFGCTSGERAWFTGEPVFNDFGSTLWGEATSGLLGNTSLPFEVNMVALHMTASLPGQGSISLEVARDGLNFDAVRVRPFGEPSTQTPRWRSMGTFESPIRLRVRSGSNANRDIFGVEYA